MDSQVSFYSKQHFTPGLVGASTQWARCPGDVLIRGPNWPGGFLLTPRSVELRQKAPLKVPHCTCEAISHFSRWYPQPGPFESLPPEHVIADKGPGVNQELRLPARPFATVAVVKQDGSLNTPSIFYSILTSLKSQQGPHALELLARCHHLLLPLKGWAAFKPFGLFLPDAGHWPFCLSSSAI